MFASLLATLLFLAAGATQSAQHVFAQLTENVSSPTQMSRTIPGFAQGTIAAVAENSLLLKEQNGHLVEVLSIDTTDIQARTDSKSGQGDTLSGLTVGAPAMVMGTPTGSAVITALSIEEGSAGE